MPLLHNSLNCHCRAESSIWLLVSIGYILQLLPLETAPVQKIPGSVCIVSAWGGTYPCSQENMAPTALPTVVGNEEGKMVARKQELLGRRYRGIWILVLTRLPALLSPGLVESLYACESRPLGRAHSWSWGQSIPLSVSLTWLLANFCHNNATW